MTLLNTELDLILLEKSGSLAILGPNQYAIQNAFHSSGRMCARDTHDTGKRHSPLDFISLRTSRGTDQSQ